jgi:hypothetical protein
MKESKTEAMFAKVSEWKQSGKSVREFAASAGLTKSTFGYWVRKKREMSKKKASFVELAPSSKPMQIHDSFTETRLSDRHQASIVITFASGMTVQIYG